jgi:hypothetical protein
MDIKLRACVINDKERLLNEWYKNMVLSLYNNDETNYIMNEKDSFINPSGYILKNALVDIFVYLFEGIELDKITESLEKFAKLLALNGSDTEKNLNILFLLKNKIEEFVKTQRIFENCQDEFFYITSKFDRLVHKLFVLYASARDKIYEIKINEVKRLTYSLLRANKLIEKVSEFNESEFNI